MKQGNKYIIRGEHDFFTHIYVYICIYSMIFLYIYIYVYLHLYLFVHLYLSIYFFLCRSMLCSKVTIYSCRISTLLTYVHRRCVESLWRSAVERNRLRQTGATGKLNNGCCCCCCCCCCCRRGCCCCCCWCCCCGFLHVELISKDSCFFPKQMWHHNVGLCVLVGCLVGLLACVFWLVGWLVGCIKSTVGPSAVIAHCFDCVLKADSRALMLSHTVVTCWSLMRQLILYTPP